MTQTGAEEVVCTYLDWDSQFFGKRIARANRHRLREAVVIEMLSWCEANEIDCLYFLADSDDARTARLARTK